MSGKNVAGLIVVTVLIVSLFSLSGCGAAWISYSKENQVKQDGQIIAQLNQQIKLLQEKVERQKAEIQEKDLDNINLINDKKDLINEKKSLFDQLEKKGYKITIKSSGGYEIDETSEKKVGK